MGIAQTIQPNRHYTYSDYISWDDDVRYELIDGTPYMMSSPSQIHQEIVARFTQKLMNFLEGKPCKIYPAPFDVRLNADKGDDIVVQPDILVVCDMSKLDGKACVGAPDMIIEILSPSTAQQDKITKLNLYRTARVREYWIVDPDSKSVHIFLLKDNEYFVEAYANPDTAPVHVLEGCDINLLEIFD